MMVKQAGLSCSGFAYYLVHMQEIVHHGTDLTILKAAVSGTR